MGWTAASTRNSRSFTSTQVSRHYKSCPQLQTSPSSSERMFELMVGYVRLQILRLATPANEILCTVSAFECALSVSYLDSLELHHHTCGFRWTPRRLALRLQLLRLFCCEFGSFAPRCLVFRGIPELLFTLASEKGTSENRPGVS